MTPLPPSRQMPLKLLHWFTHSTVREQRAPSGCLSMQSPVIELHTRGEAQSASVAQKAPPPPGVQ